MKHLARFNFKIAVLSAAAWVATSLVAAEALADAALFAGNCAKCHARATTLARSLNGATPAEKSEALDKFLAGHHATDAEVRAKLVAYLVGLAAK